MDQISLFDPPNPPSRGPGRHEKMVRKALSTAEEKGILDDTDGAGVSLALANAWALDAAEYDNQPFAVAQLTAPFIELLEKIGLITVNGGDDNDALTAALSELAGND